MKSEKRRKMLAEKHARKAEAIKNASGQSAYAKKYNLQKKGIFSYKSPFRVA